MEPANEKTDSSPQRKRVKFFERSRDQWQAQSRAAKTVRKRLGTRVRRLARRTAAYQQQSKALQAQLVEGQAQHGQTVRELEELKNKYRLSSADRYLAVSWVGRSCGSLITVCSPCWSWSPGYYPRRRGCGERDAP